MGEIWREGMEGEMEDHKVKKGNEVCVRYGSEEWQQETGKSHVIARRSEVWEKSVCKEWAERESEVWEKWESGGRKYGISEMGEGMGEL